MRETTQRAALAAWLVALWMTSVVLADGASPLPPVVPSAHPPTSGSLRYGVSEVTPAAHFEALPVQGEPPGVTCATGCCEPCCEACELGSWRDNTVFSFGGEAFKSIGDIDSFPFFGPAAAMNSAGVVSTLNSGFALGSLENVRGQAGISYGLYDFKGRDAAGSQIENQVFLTIGIYKRSQVRRDDRIACAVAYDQLLGFSWGESASDIAVGQIRGLFGYAVDVRNEIGFWGAFHTNRDDVLFRSLSAMNQYNAYWRYNFDFGGQTMFYFGGNNPTDIGSWLFGLVGQAPLSNNFALYGNFVFSQPSAASGNRGAREQEWAIAAGIAWYFGGKAVSPTVSGRKGLPLLPVANNGSLLVTD